MADWAAFYQDVRQAASNVWPEVDPDGIWEATIIELIEFTHLTPPLVVLQPTSVAEADWGMGRQEYEVEMTLHYIGAAGTDPDVLRAKLTALESYLLNTGIPHGTVLWVKALDWSEQQEINRTIILKELAFFAESIQVCFTTGDNA